MEFLGYIQAGELNEFREALKQKNEEERERLKIFTSGGASLLHWCSDNDSPEFLNELLKQKIFSDVNVKDDGGSTPLHWACDKGKKECVKLLLKSGAQVNNRDLGGETPLHWACLNGHTDCAEVLLQNDATLDVQAENGFTPLHTATINSHTECITLLLNKGASRTLRDKQGKIPSDYAKKGSQVGDYFEDSKREVLEKIKNLEKKSLSLESDLKQTQEINEDLTRRLANTLKEQISIEKELKATKEQLQQVLKENDSLKSLLETEKQNFQTATKEIDLLKEKNNLLTSQISNFQKQSLSSPSSSVSSQQIGFYDGTYHLHAERERMDQLSGLDSNLNNLQTLLNSTNEALRLAKMQLDFIMNRETK